MCTWQAPHGLPVVIEPSGKCIAEEIAGLIEDGYKSFYGAPPSHEQRKSWEGSVRALLEEAVGTNAIILAEYPIFGGAERADFLVVTEERILVIEAKGSRKIEEVDRRRALLDGSPGINPCYQAAVYADKIKWFHPAAKRAEVDSAVFAYNARPGAVRLGCTVLYRRSHLRLRSEIAGKQAPEPALVESLVHDEMVIEPGIITELLRSLGGPERVARSLAESLVIERIDLLPSQWEVAQRVLDLAQQRARAAVLVEGESGSGKTLTAIFTALVAAGRGLPAVYTTVNNRLYSYLRAKIGRKLSWLVHPAYSPRGGYGACSRRPLGNFEVIAVDEAQRLTVGRPSPLEMCTRGNASVVALFYDPAQVLLANEATPEDLERAAAAAERMIIRIRLPRPVRVPAGHVTFVRGLLRGELGEQAQGSPLEVRLFYKPRGYIAFREELLSAWGRGEKVVQVCAFTESRGSMKRWYDWRHPDNIRIGYPLPSGFDRYKGLGVRVKWLMDAREEYLLYWDGRLNDLQRKYVKRRGDPPSTLTPVDLCASVYGVQGFEAETVGVVWGRDLVWRKGWTPDPGPITDYVGGKRYSIESLAKKSRRDPLARRRLLELLKNRYYIMLTRATKTLLIYFEDDQTAEAVSSLTGLQLEE